MAEITMMAREVNSSGARKFNGMKTETWKGIVRGGCWWCRWV